MNQTEDSAKEKMRGKGWAIFFLITFLGIASLAVNAMIFWDAIENQINVEIPEEYNLEGLDYNQFTGETLDEVYDHIRGRVPILEYHIIETSRIYSNFIRTGRLKRNKKTERFFVTSEELRGQLNALYSNNFRNISLNEYLSLLKGKKKELERLPPDSKLYILSFDDATYGQFDFSGTNSSGKGIIDPDCAVGIMLEFARKHPDFKLNAAFCVDFENVPFRQKENIGEKFNLLLDYGFEIVNHTMTHKKLARLIPQRTNSAAYEIGRAMELFESYLGYRAASIDKICYPDGSASKAVWDFVKKVRYNGKEYRFNAALDATGMQAKHPNEARFNIYNISRIETSKFTFEKFVLNSPNLYKTPSLKEKNNLPDYAFSGDITVSNCYLDLIKLP
jgi:hypothetical protein